MGLLVAGNVFCLACPFMLPRTIARKWWTPGRRWPRWLRGKWLAAGLLVLFFWAYEAFALWDSPWLTAWIIVGYFVAAFVVDAFFHGAAFCKYVCPVGQFNFVQSLVSPVEVAVRDPAVCRTCATHDCLRGNADGPGCELHLFQPRKAGNLDCTFCLDCVHACPHDNVGLLAAVPGAALWQDRPRSSVGRFVRRPDLAALVLVLVFAAFVNAAGMVAPVVEWQDRLTADLGLSGPRPVLTACFALGLLVLPVLLVGTAATLGRWWSGETEGLLAAATRYSFALVPLGAGMWLAHYSFHLLASGAGLVAVHRFTADMGLSLLAEPQMICCSCAAPPGWLLRLEIVFLEAGLLLSLYTAYRISRGRHVRTADALKVLAPWAALIVLLFVAGVWLVFQPMQMRGAAPLG
jgi:ferredoxin